MLISPSALNFGPVKVGTVSYPDLQGHRQRNHLPDHHPRGATCRRVLDSGPDA